MNRMYISKAIVRMENDLYDFDFDNVEFQGEDSHAWYFLGSDIDHEITCEIKVEKKDYYAWYKEEGAEDWNGMDYLYDN